MLCISQTPLKAYWFCSTKQDSLLREEKKIKEKKKKDLQNKYQGDNPSLNLFTRLLKKE